MTKRQKTIKFVLFLAWMVLIGFALRFFLTAGIPLKDYPELIREFIEQFGFWGPLLYILIYAIRPLIFFPATLLTAVSGLLFGPYLGILYTVVGENLSANFAFLIGRYFGRHFVASKEQGVVKSMDKKFEENGFITVLLMRLLYFPFDLTNYLCGLSAVKHRDYFFATLIGIMPGLVTFVLLGTSFMDPRNLIVTAVIFGVSLFLSIKLKKRHSHLAGLKSLLDKK